MASRIFDDLLPLFCTIESARSTGDHIEYVIKVQRGHGAEDIWTLRRRYSDFATLDAGLKPAGVSLSLPPKKVFGNTTREFIAERQQKLQVYLNKVLANPILANSLCTKQFLYDDAYEENFSELALQHISMLLRGEPTWEVVEPLVGIGGRIRKSYVLAKNKSIHKKRYMLTWCSTGPYASLEEKERMTVIKCLESLQHSYLLPVVSCSCSTAGAMIIRPYMENGSLRDQIYKAKPKMHYLKKYGNPKTFSPLSLPDIRKYGRQILEIVKYMTDKGFPMGHIHLGNVFIEDGNVRLSDIENFTLGLSPLYRSFITYHKKCNTLEALNAYAFGHMLYQMVYGVPLNSSVYEALPGASSPDLESILSQLLTSESLKHGIPSIEDLLALPLFADVPLPAIPKPAVKIPSKLKESLGNSKSQFEQKVKEDQRLVSQLRKRSKAHAHHMTDEERRKRKQSQKKSVVDDSQDIASQSALSMAEKSSSKTDVSSSRRSVKSAAPPAPPAPAPPPPPATPAPPAGNQPPLPKADSSRGALLDSIGGFAKGKLKKAVTVDKSVPKLSALRYRIAKYPNPTEPSEEWMENDAFIDFIGFAKFNHRRVSTEYSVFTQGFSSVQATV